MAKKALKEKKNIIVLLSIFILFTLTLCSCNWFGEGILNVFDPQAQIRVNFTEVKFAKGEGTIDLEIYSINQVEFIGEGFKYRYYKDGVLIPELSKDVGLAFYVAPSDSPGKPGEITKITDLPLYYQQVVDYVTMNPKITEIACTVSLIGTDGAGHDLAKSITVDFPAVQPGVDFEPPNAVITVSPGIAGSAPFIVQFDASQSTDNRGIASYSWDFGDGTSGTGIMPAPHTYTCGAYVVKLSVTDHWGNVGYDTVIINVGETGGPSVIIEVTPGTTGNAPFTVYFDASKTKIETQCGTGTATYSWNFGDGSTGTGATTSHTYTTNGVYTVILTVTDSDGNKGYGSVVINVGVEGKVNAVINTIPASASGAAPFTIYLDASMSTTSVPGASIVSYTWNDGTVDKVTTIPITTYVFSSKGTYLVQLTVEDSLGNKGYAAVSVTVTE
jgi:PKD repeat protein